MGWNTVLIFWKSLTSPSDGVSYNFPFAALASRRLSAEYHQEAQARDALIQAARQNAPKRPFPAASYSRPDRQDT
jgi:hypothetical protein